MDPTPNIQVAIAYSPSVSAKFQFLEAIDNLKSHFRNHGLTATETRQVMEAYMALTYPPPQ